MCLSMSLISAGMSPGAPAGAQEAGGGMLQAGAMGLGALGSLASGVISANAARADAAAARAVGQAKAGVIRRAGAREVGRSRSDAVGAGVSVNSGSALEAERQIVTNVEQDAGVAILTGESRARQAQAVGRNAMINGTLGALAGMTTAADKWKRARSAAIGNVPLGGGGGYVPIAGE